MNKPLKLFISITIPQAAGIIGSLFTRPAIQTWYTGISKPAFNPPNWIFAPVWTALFIFMGIALYIVWAKPVVSPALRRKAFIVFAVQLLLNMAWSIVFFGMHSLAGGMAVIILLWPAILWNIIVFYKISKYAGVLLVPYILWVSFAALLNASFIALNL